MNSQLYTLTALTNLHVGSGDSHYGIIDNLVQRDVLTKYPSIHSSSLKGALREAFDNTPELTKVNLKKLFGDGGTNEGMAGSYSFGSPQLLSFPVRSDKAPFLRVTSPNLIQHLLDSQEQLKFTLTDDLLAFARSVKSINEPTVFVDSLNGSILERHTIKATFANKPEYSAAMKLFGENLAVVPHNVLEKLCGENRLPVIARNHLENGVSRNLWYEEVVPRQTRFWFWVYPKKKEAEADKKALATDFQKLIQNPVQIGANASIGYGFCKIEHHP